MRKRVSLWVVVMTLATGSLIAQKEKKPFQHLGVGIEVGTTGIGFQIASPINSQFTLRAGLALFPFTYSTNFDIDYGTNFSQADWNGILNTDVPGYGSIGQILEENHLPTQLEDDVKLDAKLGLINGKILVDFYPSKKSSFHLTAGLYMGKSKLITVTGYVPTDIKEISDFLDEEPYKTAIDEAGYGHFSLNSGIVIGDYTITPDNEGKVDASIKINGVKPYVGFGFGRAVLKKRIGAQFELGAMFHGKPKVVSNNKDTQDLLKSEMDGSGFTDIMNKITVYPVMTFRLNGRIF